MWIPKGVNNHVITGYCRGATEATGTTYVAHLQHRCGYNERRERSRSSSTWRPVPRSTAAPANGRLGSQSYHVKKSCAQKTWSNKSLFALQLGMFMNLINSKTDLQGQTWITINARRIQTPDERPSVRAIQQCTSALTGMFLDAWPSKCGNTPTPGNLTVHRPRC